MARTINVGPVGKRFSRLREHAKNNLGTIMTDQGQAEQLFRKADLDLFDQYYESTQYDGLIDWESALKQDEYVQIRDRKPRIIYNLPKVLTDKVAAKLVGESVFPTFEIEEDPVDTEFFRIVQKACQFRTCMISPVKHLLRSGSVFIRYQIVNGTIKIEHTNSKFAYPTFDENGELEQLEIKYIYDDADDKKQNGDPKKKWYRMLLGKTEDVLFDNPEYLPNVTPQFNPVETTTHELGFVQGEWLTTHKDAHNPDGFSLYGEILDFIDELNYSLSQTSQAVGYNQEPQLTVTKIDEDELEALIRSSQKAWNLGREGKAEFVGSDMKGIEAAEASRDHFKSYLLDVVRVVLHDPEKMVANAQSGKALEVLHGPLLELIDEIRSQIEPSLCKLLIKIAMTVLLVNATGANTVIQTPPGYQPSSLDLVVKWPDIFPPTLDDILKKAQIGQIVTQAKLISRETITRWLAPLFDVENIDEELSKIESEPDLNPFGTFGGDAGGGGGQGGGKDE